MPSPSNTEKMDAEKIDAEPTHSPSANTPVDGAPARTMSDPAPHALGTLFSWLGIGRKKADAAKVEPA